MGSADRRNAIIKILRLRRHETIKNLAQEFGVSTRTIRRDVEAISLMEPIYTQSGRYGGGVYVIDSYLKDIKAMTGKELIVLNKLYDMVVNNQKCILTEEEMRTFKGIVNNYSKIK